MDVLFINLLGNGAVRGAVTRKTRRQVQKVRKFDRFLIAADLNIGDAVITQGVVAGIRQIFPQAEIDCVIKKSAEDLITGNPDISHLYPIYTGAPFPEESDIEALVRIVQGKDYDLIINFGPMIPNKIFGKKTAVNYSIMAAELIRNEGSPGAVNNVCYQAHNFIGTVFSDFAPKNFADQYEGVRVYLSAGAIDSAADFLSANHIFEENPIIMFNPDASAKFTRMPFALQRSLLKEFARIPCTILLGAGHVAKHIEHELMHALSPEERRKVVIIPSSVKIDVYTALIDHADVFITGDAGPLHLAAARKYDRNSSASLRNKTAVFSVFGATPPRIYGYDSSRDGFFPANQDAPARTFFAKSSCRNITCINKLAKTCREVRCFQSLDPNEIISEVVNHLETIRRFNDQAGLRVLRK